MGSTRRRRNKLPRYGPDMAPQCRQSFKCGHFLRRIHIWEVFDRGITLHYAMGPKLKDIPEVSWKYVLEEKSPDRIQALQFPWNGKFPRSRLRKYLQVWCVW
ncbi:uncharacterized protein EI97DRAFT_72203 [Westerdykella ornata]|uniref:Uncharacterized protein n=1 Tax=Westerdykella ornata TaxID=318751 RepID=A0A6A6JG66_WESOR|nr:uncharacterized protein EI97DRAFT_72203 [Westerdykella ornata]KAF2275327.1 hypothetical protein EI97DRAFT_72203 [Westerdykella ornata]